MYVRDITANLLSLFANTYMYIYRQQSTLIASYTLVACPYTLDLRRPITNDEEVGLGFELGYAHRVLYRQQFTLIASYALAVWDTTFTSGIMRK